jgi:SAM-dependent methyltransferase
MADDTTNYWFDDGCARAFWDQKTALPYQELTRDTFAHVDPRPGERWIDLGCGCGQLAATLWKRSDGEVAEVLALDCAAANAEAIDKLRSKLLPPPAPEQFHFRVADFSAGLGFLDSASYDGVISGLAISYAESRDPVTGAYTDRAYNALLADVFRVLKPGGRFVFSVNVPEPRFWRIFWRSMKRGLRVAHVRRVLVNAIKMQSYGKWLKREARRGRFHFFPMAEICARLERAGFRVTAQQLSYADQAYVIRAEKPAVTAAMAA